MVEHLARMPYGHFLDDLFPPGRLLQGGDGLHVWKHLSVPPEEPELAGKSERNQKTNLNRSAGFPVSDAAFRFVSHQLCISLSFLCEMDATQCF